MLTDKQKEDFPSLRVEIIGINILAHSFIRKLNRFGYLFQKAIRHHMYDEFVGFVIWEWLNSSFDKLSSRLNRKGRPDVIGPALDFFTI